MKLAIRKSIPKEWFTCKPSHLHRLLGGPTLFDLEGKNASPILISTLLHGNEQSGVIALQNWLKRQLSAGEKLSRSLLIFIGNTKAAENGLRKVPDGADFNRIWGECPFVEAEIARQLIQSVSTRELFASVDIHNNTGKNPCYSCVSRWETSHLFLASRFGHLVVHAEQPVETFTHFFSSLAPAVTLECGQSMDPVGIRLIETFLDAIIGLNSLSKTVSVPNSLKGYRTLARIRIHPTSQLSFGDTLDTSDLCFRSDIENLNFIDLPPGEVIGQYRGMRPNLSIEDATGKDPGILGFIDGKIITKQTLTPCMFTTSEKAIRDDCLGYLMVHKPNG